MWLCCRVINHSNNFLSYFSCMQVINCANENVSEWVNEWMDGWGQDCWGQLACVFRLDTSAMWSHTTCTAVRCGTRWQRAYGWWQQVCMRCTSWPLVLSSLSSSFSNNGLSPCSLSPWSPPDPISCFICPLSNYLYLTLRPAGQHGWLVSCQQSKWGIRGISWSFYRGWPWSWQRAFLATPERCRHSCMNNFAPLM